MCRIMGFDLPSTLVYDYPTAEGISAMLLSQLPRPAAPQDPAAQPQDQMTTSENDALNVLASG